MKKKSADIIGLKNILNGADSDSNLWDFIYSKANLNPTRMWLIRFAFPHVARDQLISKILSKYEYESKPDYIYLFEKIINCDLNILTINPFSNNFLIKMDSEGADNYKISRVKNQILKVLEGINTLRKNSDIKCTIGCYDSIPLWNMCIIEVDKKYHVLLKSYGLDSAEIGHNTKAEIELESNGESLLAESFVSYCLNQNSSQTTTFFKDEKSIDNFKKNNQWPSLFKSNIVKSDNEISNGRYVAKFFNSEPAYNIELKYYNIQQQAKEFCTTFRIPSFHRRVKTADIWAGSGTGICFEYVEGFTWFEIIGAMNKYYEQEKEENQLIMKKLLGILLTQSIKALNEFRQLVKDCGIDKELIPYPYKIKIQEAIKECIHFSKNTFNEMPNLIKDIDQLSSFLNKSADTVFRDAHIKNRLFKSSESTIENLVNKIINEFENNLDSIVLKDTYDIDFETSQYLVTEWDDICHILLFDCSGTLSIDLNVKQSIIIDEGNNLLNVLGNLFGISIEKKDRNLFWQTLLFRATREHLRRVWYANIMPQTYQHRYSNEESLYYLKLAIYARINSNSYMYLQQFLEWLYQEHDSLFYKITQNNEPFKLTPIINTKQSLNNSSYNLTLEEKINEIYNILTIAQTPVETDIKDKLYDCFDIQPDILGISVDFKKLFILIRRLINNTKRL